MYIYLHTLCSVMNVRLNSYKHQSKNSQNVVNVDIYKITVRIYDCDC